ncbi:hypothetical protein [uncultured Pseudomonas sp.]|uniref:hypothetical protein n=1 Tax=uncultured Pseudomonas sp. TaxID=114707 RepID=UPI0025837C40|nr:hypothetical protein [uncultured Pseudomonas sp.]
MRVGNEPQSRLVEPRAAAHHPLAAPAAQPARAHPTPPPATSLDRLGGPSQQASVFAEAPRLLRDLLERRLPALGLDPTTLKQAQQLLQDELRTLEWLADQRHPLESEHE